MIMGSEYLRRKLVGLALQLVTVALVLSLVIAGLFAAKPVEAG